MKIDFAYCIYIVGINRKTTGFVLAHKNSAESIKKTKYERFMQKSGKLLKQMLCKKGISNVGYSTYDFIVTTIEREKTRYQCKCH